MTIRQRENNTSEPNVMEERVESPIINEMLR